MNTEGGQLPPELIAAIVCERMGWTLDQYDAQPTWFVQTLILKWVEETAYQKAHSKL